VDREDILEHLINSEYLIHNSLLGQVEALQTTVGPFVLVEMVRFAQRDGLGRLHQIKETKKILEESLYDEI
jgi:hypothetical protein